MSSTKITKKIADMGKQMLLDIVNVPTQYQLSQRDSAVKLSEDVLNLLKLKQESSHVVEQKSYNGFNVNLFGQDFRLSVNTFPQHQQVTIDISYTGEKATEQMINFEVALCDFFGWDNVTGQLTLQRGVETQYLMNHLTVSSTLYKNFQFVHREQSEYQDIRVYDTNAMGRIMCLDYQIQISDQLEDNYTIDLSRCVVNHEDVFENILMIGAGDMYIPTYILEKYQNVKRLTVVEIDRQVTDVVKKYFKISSTIDKEVQNGRLNIIYDDGAKYIQQAVNNNVFFDGIIIDNTDMNYENSAAQSLFTVEFYKNIYNSLKTGASFSQQVTDDIFKQFWENKVRAAGFNQIKYVFSKTPEYVVDLPLGIAKKV